jgi:thiamine kinase-like enzyme
MELTDTEFRQAFEKNLKVELDSVEERPGGANSRAFRLVDAQNRSYLAKLYLGFEGEDQERLKTEYESLKLRWIPEPMFADYELRMGVFSFIEGRKFEPNEIDRENVLKAIHCLCELQNLQNKKSSWDIPAAKEACFSISEYIESLRQRVQHLQDVDNSELKAYLKGDIERVMDSLRDKTIRQSAKNGVRMTDVLSEGMRILSPSDVGFHNILKADRDQSPVLIDFEYFGWDDPVKMICDFVLQPENPIPESIRSFFVSEFIKQFPTQVDLKARFPVVFPILSMRWCLIMLNAFLPNRRQSRKESDLKELMEKSKRHLDVLSQRLQTEEYMLWVNQN